MDFSEEIIHSDDGHFRRSSFSTASDGNCVQVAVLPGARAIRDTYNVEGPVLVYTDTEWKAFIAGVKNCEFD